MISNQKKPQINIINLLINILLLILPFEVLISNYSLQLNRGVKLDLVYGSWILVLIMVLITKINWAIAYKLNNFLIISTVLITFWNMVSSLIINTSTSNLFLEGFNYEIIPIILLVVIYIYSQQNQFILNRTTKIVFIFNIAITNLFFILSGLKNLPPKATELLTINPNYYGLLNLIYLVILASIYSKSNTNKKNFIRVIASFLIFIQLVFAPLTSIFGIVGAILLYVKNKYLDLVLTRYIVLSVFTITLGLGFLTNLSGLTNIEFVNTVRRDFTIINQSGLQNLYGYGVGNTSKVGQFRFGSNYTRFVTRPIIQKSNLEQKELIPKVELGVIEIIFSGGVIYAFLYYYILANITYSFRRNSNYFYGILSIFLTSLFFNPFSFLPIFVTLAIGIMLVN